MSLVDAALRGAGQEKPKAATRSAFIIGNVGKLGEEVLNILLESAKYDRVAVGVRKSMRTVTPRLFPVPVPAARGGWDPVAALGRAPDDLYLCLEPKPPSFWRLAKPYVEIGSGEAVEIARRMRAAGTRRLAVVTPLEAILQLGMESTIRNTDEMALVQAGFERLVILRPSAEDQASAPKGFFRGVGGLVVRTLGSVMMPKRLRPVRVRHAAEIVVQSLADLEDGVHVIGAGRLFELVGDPMEGSPPR